MEEDEEADNTSTSISINKDHRSGSNSMIISYSAHEGNNAIKAAELADKATNHDASSAAASLAKDMQQIQGETKAAAEQCTPDSGLMAIKMVMVNNVGQMEAGMRASGAMIRPMATGS